MMHLDEFPRKTVAVHPAERIPAIGSLLEVLATLFPVRFVPHAEAMSEADGLLSVALDSAVAEGAFRAGLPVLSIPEGNRSEYVSPERVRFVSSPAVQPFLRGIECPVEAAGGFRAKCGDGDECVAVVGEAPVWSERRHGRATFRQVATGLPGLRPGQPVFPELLHGGWIRWLPLFHFLRELTADIDWQPQGLRACFMFDDPNLHWWSWGFINYQELAAHARRHHYHASIATVPLDMWFTHVPTAALFREQAQFLSLLVHGVEHTHAELQRPKPAGRRLGDLTWSLQQVQALEERHGLRISRVMAPPHHACSVDAANLMLQAGYEAACVAWMFLMQANPGLQWRPDFGLQPAEFLGEGFPVLPRFNFANQDPGRAVLAAFFHQPIIMIGHHQDVAGGLEVLADWARLVNRMGDVRWANLEEIIQSNYLTRRVNGTLFVKLGARNINLSVPEGVHQIVLERPWVAADQLESVHLMRPETVSELSVTHGGRAGPFPVSSGEQLTVQCATPKQTTPSLRSTPLRIWPVTRRLACETRDRLLPLFGRVRRAASPRPLATQTKADPSRS